MHFFAHIHTKDTNFIFGTLHTQYRYIQTNGHTEIHMDTDVVPLSHLHFLWHACMPKIKILYLACHRYTHAQIHKHMHTHICRDTSTYRYRHMHTVIHKHIWRHTQTHMHIFYIHKHTYIYVSQFCLLILYLVAICQWAQAPMDLFIIIILLFFLIN